MATPSSVPSKHPRKKKTPTVLGKAKRTRKQPKRATGGDGTSSPNKRTVSGSSVAERALKGVTLSSGMTPRDVIRQANASSPGKRNAAAPGLTRAQKLLVKMAVTAAIASAFYLIMKAASHGEGAPTEIMTRFKDAISKIKGMVSILSTPVTQKLNSMFSAMVRVFHITFEAIRSGALTVKDRAEVSMAGAVRQVKTVTGGIFKTFFNRVEGRDEAGSDLKLKIAEYERKFEEIDARLKAQKMRQDVNFVYRLFKSRPRIVYRSEEQRRNEAVSAHMLMVIAMLPLSLVFGPAAISSSTFVGYGTMLMNELTRNFV